LSRAALSSAISSSVYSRFLLTETGEPASIRACWAVEACQSMKGWCKDERHATRSSKAVWSACLRFLE
jgi:hypothetical protein